MSRGHLVWCCSSTCSQQLFLLTHKKNVCRKYCISCSIPYQRQSTSMRNAFKIGREWLSSASRFTPFCSALFFSLHDAICHITDTSNPLTRNATRPSTLPNWLNKPNDTMVRLKLCLDLSLCFTFLKLTLSTLSSEMVTYMKDVAKVNIAIKPPYFDVMGPDL